MERRLAAILAADVVGYTRLMGADETGTLRRLTELRQQVLEPLIAEHHGRVVKLMGDGLLVEFASVVNALTCAVAWQNGVAQREAAADEDKRLKFRIGINLGDVIVEGDDIHGDGVNIAARLEGLAEPGGICISAKVYEEVRNKLPIAFEDLGEQEVKNIPEPVRVYRWTDAVASTTDTVRTDEPLPLPDKPSIAVLPFTNMSGDAEQEYFSDGITEDIITGLSKNPDLFVISHHSTFAFKGQPVKVKDISRELGVRYVLEGSIRKAGQRIRVTAQLIDATTDRHLWAERFDREMEDIFAVQDEIVGIILHNVGAAGGKLEQLARAAAMQKDTNSLKAYDYYLRGKEHVYRYRDEGFAEARELYEKAIELDPEFARAHSALAFMYTRWINFGPENPADLLSKALELARRAMHLDPSDYRSHWSLGAVYLMLRKQAQAIAEFERAIALNPNDAGLLAVMVDALTYVGRSEDAIELAKEAIRRNPNSPVYCFRSLAAAYYLLHRYDEALATLQKITVPLDARRQFAITYAQLGRLREAHTEANEFLEIYPSFSIQRWAKTEPYANPEDLEHHIDGLRKAGLPE